MKRLVAAGFAAAAIATGVPSHAEQDCRLQLAASLPMTLESSGHVAVMGTIGDRPVKLVVDTGGVTMLRESVAKQLGLDYQPLKHWQNASIFGDIHMHRSAVVRGFTLGGLRADGISFLLIPDEDGKLSGLPDGILGENVLSLYDVDIDYAHAKMNLFLPHRCPGRAVYWTQNEDLIAKVPMEFGGDFIKMKVTVEGKQIRAILDTGATDTVMDLETYMPEFGLKPDSPGMQRIGAADDPHPRYLYTFKTLSFEGVTVNNAKVQFVSQDASHDPYYNMLVGEDILRQLHLYISFQEKTLFITSASAN